MIGRLEIFARGPAFSQPIGLSSKRRWLFAFLEADDGIVLDATFEGPCGGSFPTPKSGTSLRRLRFSGIDQDLFIEAEPVFERLDPGRAAAADQRARRRGQLASLFEKAPLPVIQIDDDGTLNVLNTVLNPGSWFFLALKQRPTFEGAPWVLAGTPEDGGEDQIYALEFLAPVSQGAGERLRNVFSLAHVADLGADGGEGGSEPEPFPPEPDDGVAMIILSDRARDPQDMTVEIKIEEASWSTETAPSQPLRITLGD